MEHRLYGWAAAIAASLAAGTAVAEPAVRTEGGIEIKDGAYKFEFEGRAMWDFAIFDNDVAQNVSGSEFRRIRMTAKGEAFGWGYVIQPDFADDAVTMKDVYIWRKLGFGRIQLGQFKQPFSLEELTSSKWITVMERSTVAELAASRQMGIGLFGSAGAMTWAASAYNLDTNDGDTSEGIGAGARLTFAPVAETGRVVHLGLAAAQESYGVSTAGGDNERYRVRYRPVGHLSDASRLTLVDLNNGERTSVTKLGLEGAAVFGPLSIQAEYARAAAEDDSEEGEVSAYYLQLAWTLTGEPRSYKADKGVFDKIKPSRDGGAWELVLRFDHADGNENPIGGAATRDVELDIVTAGINWYPNRNVKLMLDYWTAKSDDVLNGATLDEPAAITGRVQFHF